MALACTPQGDSGRLDAWQHGCGCLDAWQDGCVALGARQDCCGCTRWCWVAAWGGGLMVPSASLFMYLRAHTITQMGGHGS
jgi:hypothetical protein